MHVYNVSVEPLVQCLSLLAHARPSRQRCRQVISLDELLRRRQTLALAELVEFGTSGCVERAGCLAGGLPEYNACAGPVACAECSARGGSDVLHACVDLQAQKGVCLMDRTPDCARAEFTNNVCPASADTDIVVHNDVYSAYENSAHVACPTADDRRASEVAFLLERSQDSVCSEFMHEESHARASHDVTVPRVGCSERSNSELGYKPENLENMAEDDETSTGDVHALSSACSSCLDDDTFTGDANDAGAHTTPEKELENDGSVVAGPTYVKTEIELIDERIDDAVKYSSSCVMDYVNESKAHTTLVVEGMFDKMLHLVEKLSDQVKRCSSKMVELEDVRHKVERIDTCSIEKRLGEETKLYRKKTDQMYKDMVQCSLQNLGINPRRATLWRFFAQGRCKHGDQCSYSHGPGTNYSGPVELNPSCEPRQYDNSQTNSFAPQHVNSSFCSVESQLESQHNYSSFDKSALDVARLLKWPDDVDNVSCKFPPASADEKVQRWLEHEFDESDASQSDSDSWQSE